MAYFFRYLVPGLYIYSFRWEPGEKTALGFQCIYCLLFRKYINASKYIINDIVTKDNIDEAKKELGYEPKYLYLDMLRDMKKERDLGRF